MKSTSGSKETGINLKKGSSIHLEKNEQALKNVCVGLNWGAIHRKLFFGLIKDTDSVDLDGSITAFDKAGKEVYTVFYEKLKSPDGAISHSGDDIEGDLDGDDGLDNEVIQIYLDRVYGNVEQLVIYLNSYRKQDFADIPYSKIRIFEGTKYEVNNVLATLNLSSDPKYKGYISMILAKLVRTSKGWQFKAIGEPVTSKKIDDTIELIQEKYL